MSYAEQAEKAIKDGTVERLTTEIYKFVEGNVFVGKFQSRELVKSKDPKLPDFYRYYFDADDGPVSVLFSGAFDRDTGPKLKGGCVYQFTHKGTIQLGPKKQFKQIQTLLISEADEHEEEDLQDPSF